MIINEDKGTYYIMNAWELVGFLLRLYQNGITYDSLKHHGSRALQLLPLVN